MLQIIYSLLTNISDYLNQGGYVVYPLVGVSLWMWYLIIKKLCLLYVGKGRRISQTGEIRAAMSEFENQKTSDAEVNKKFLYSRVQTRQNELEQHIQTIFVLASVAPLLGLLGTVMGMISTFEAISQFGSANARALATGIRESLITTQLGLIVAVPGLVMGCFIRRRTDNIQIRMERWKLRSEELVK